MLLSTIVFLISGILLLNEYNIKKRCTKIAKGRILGDETFSYTDADNIRRYSDCVSYIYYLDGAKAVRGSISKGYFPRHYNVGDSIEVYYNPRKYTEHYVKDLERDPFKFSNFFGVLFIILAIIMFCIGIIYYFY